MLKKKDKGIQMSVKGNETHCTNVREEGTMEPMEDHRACYGASFLLFNSDGVQAHACVLKISPGIK